MKLVLCHGVFDLLHVGHIRHLEEASSFGDYLVVSVVPDRFITKRQPICTENERVALLKALRCVNNARLCGEHGPEALIDIVRPDVYVRGADYIGKRMPESEILERLGIEVRYTAPSPYSTTKIIEKIKGLTCQ